MNIAQLNQRRRNDNREWTRIDTNETDFIRVHSRFRNPRENERVVRVAVCGFSQTALGKEGSPSENSHFHRLVI